MCEFSDRTKEARPEDFRFPIQTDITTGETWIKVKFMLVKISQYWIKEVFKVPQSTFRGVINTEDF